ncbi:unnamed protein product [Candidula unifasciata]|uniref:Vertnin n=1 Tax=Candidula unifasciata TaxID=100452 RepID=A0A8S3ZSC7_9EUPU|nr:unnamed protein product [Candidula unifasciata]
MASIRRTDIMQKKYSKGRPAKSERDKIYKRQEVYKWRDLRRVYLASSFDRWRKLRSSLKLKDSSLAWHLMEAHEKGYCTFCRHCHHQSTKERGKRRRKFDRKDFLPTLIATVRQLCYTHFDFNECIEIVGLLCLEFDKAHKENFSINECVQSSGYHVSDSSAELLNCSLEDTDAKSSLVISPADYQDIHELNVSAHKTSSLVASTPCSAVPTDTTTLSANINLSQTENLQLQTSFEDLDTLCATSDKPFVPQENVTNDEHPSDEHRLPCTLLRNAINTDSTCMQASPRQIEHMESTAVTFQLKPSEEKLVDSSMCSESEPSLEIDIENMDTSQEEDNTNKNSQKELLPDPKLKLHTCCGDSSLPFVGNDLKSQQTTENITLHSSGVSKVPSSEFTCEVAEKDPPVSCPVKPDSMDLPLDMSVLKPIVKKEPGYGLSSNRMYHKQAVIDKKSIEDNIDHNLISETTSMSPQSSRRSPFWLEGLHTLPGKVKEEGHVSIPWQRRDMSRKEEYEFLEMNPFSDLADFSQRYPHVHQRTYYRWKRRIKEEYIILEQCPSMSFQDFSSVVLQAKESVFLHWKSLIAQGKGFFAPSDTKRLESKPCVKPSSQHNSAFAFMQKNLTCTYEQFCQQYPGTPADVYNVLKRKAMQEFWLFHQNKHLSYKEFSKIVSVTEDVFNTWKEYIEGFRSNTVSSNLKTVSNNLAQNQSLPVPSIYSLDSSHSLTPDLQSSTEGGYRIKDGCTINESKAAAHSGSLNSALSDSVVRSLSTSYLASLQNMMFPWHSYYGMTSPLGQQMLPMMLWPGMMGLAGGLTNSIGLMSGLHANGLSEPSSGTELRSSMLESTESIKSDESQSSQSDEYTHSSNIFRSSENQEQAKNLDSSDSEKRLKLSSDRDDMDVSGSASRSRKQNKQEYIYYLKNPELCFKELESLFPSISLRTFYRWRKEMNAAVLLLEDNKDLPFCQFQMIFPDIPEDIFELWKERVGRGLSPTSEKHIQQSLESGEIYHPNQSTSVSGRNSAELSKLMESRTAEVINSNFSHNSITNYVHFGGKESGARLFKKVKEGYHYVQKNPDVDIASFTKLYPDTSVRSFYRWKKELKNTFAFLRANPAMTYAEYKLVDSTVTEEVFRVWKALALDNNVIKEEILEDHTSAGVSETGISNHSSKFISPEYWFLQLNPYIEYSQFCCTYPDVAEHTFYRWKQEIYQIMNYIRAEPVVELADIAAMLPQVSEDAFSRWKQIIAMEKENSVDHKRAVTKEVEESAEESEVKQESNSQISEAMLYLMHNPTVDYDHLRVKFDCVTIMAFDQWLNRIKSIIMFIVSKPSINYTAFSTNFNDITEDIFKKWKNLSSAEIAALNIDKEHNSTDDRELRSISDNQGALSLEAFEFCQKNSRVTFSAFQTLYPTVSEKVFHGWKTRIQEEIQYIQENLHLTFDDYAKVYTNTSKEIFDQWKSEMIQNYLRKPSGKVDQAGDGPLETSDEENFEEDMSRDEPSNPETVDQNVEDEIFRKSGNGETLMDQEVYSLCVGESLENEPKESSLSKLAKFADSGAAAHPRKDATAKLLTSFEHLLGNNNNTSVKLEPVSLPSGDDDCLSSAEASLPAHQLHSEHNPLSGKEMGNVYASGPLSSALHTSSLSALMAMTRSDDTHHSGSSPASAQKEPGGHSAQFVCSGNLNWQETPNGSNSFSSAGVSKEDDEAFSSQRQKKMSRAEYLFVKDNPDVDSQEFSRIFPGVSARTFYRWKKEIKTQLHLA